MLDELLVLRRQQTNQVAGRVDDVDLARTERLDGARDLVRMQGRQVLVADNNDRGG